MIKKKNGTDPSTQDRVVSISCEMNSISDDWLDRASSRFHSKHPAVVFFISFSFRNPCEASFSLLIQPNLTQLNPTQPGLT